MNTHAHIIYGLFRNGDSRRILYVGSWDEASLPARIEQHRRGECRTTKKMATKYGVPLDDLRAHILAIWKRDSPEARIIHLCQSFGMARWNRPFAFSSEDCRNGGRIQGRRAVETGHFAKIKTPETCAKGGRRGGKRNAEKPGFLVAIGRKNAEKHGHAHMVEIGRRGGLAGGPRGGRIQGTNNAQKPGYFQKIGRMSAHVRWHVNRGITAPACPICVERGTK